MSDLDIKRDTCGCCEGIQALTPVTLQNQPGLSALAYRVGTHAGFKITMQSALTGHPALLQLTTRDDDDPAIALCDAWAMVLDVLSFYQERIANEGYLRTATERRSILELARSIGYELRPGVAAGTYLAFTLETAAGAPASAKIGVGTKAQSVPGQDEISQVFETVEEIEARGVWNALKPRRQQPAEIGKGCNEIYLKGTATQLKPGDALLFVGDARQRWPGSERWDFRILQTVKTDDEKNVTHVTWEEGLGHAKPTVEPADNPKVFAFRKRAALFGHNAPDWRTMSEEIKKAYAPKDWSKRKQWPDFKIQTTDKSLIDLDAAYPEIVEGSWIVLRKPTYIELYKALRIVTDSRTDFTLTSKTTRIELDTREHLSWFELRDTVVFAQSEQLELADNPLNTPVFGIKVILKQKIEDLDQGRLLIIEGKPVRRVQVTERLHVTKVGKEEVTQEEPALSLVSLDGSEKVKLEPGDVLDVVEPPSLLDGEAIRWHLKDNSGFAGFVTSDQDDFIPVKEQSNDAQVGSPDRITEKDVAVSEVVVLDRSDSDDISTTLFFSGELRNVYHRDTVVINANVAKATHGETKKEILGSGNGSKPFQQFKLKQKPLTHVSAATPDGTKSTLELRVNDLLWEGVSSLNRQPPGKRAYISRIADDGTVNVQFGDGINGLRPPTGTENISAQYRIGTGLGGMVKAKQISMLMTQTLGVKGVINPLAPTGAADPEKLENARRNAPLTVLTFERIVALKDYEDFASAFAGIGKAQANMLWDGEQRLIHITVAGADGGSVPETSTLYKNLTDGINVARHPDFDVVVESYESLSFDVKASIQVDRSYIAEDVFSAIKTALSNTFSFEKRSFGQAVTQSEIYATIQKVRGVVALDLDGLYFTSENADVAPRLPQSMAEWEVALKKPARLLIVNPQGITLTEMTI